MVPARLTVVTIGARDLASLRDFYKSLGWPLAIELDDFAVFQTRGAVVALFPLEQLVEDARAPGAVKGAGLRGVSLAINVDERDDVDQAIEAARSAGARISKDPVDAEWGGRTAYFVDPEDNYWEVAWVPPDSNMAQAIRRASNLE